MKINLKEEDINKLIELLKIENNNLKIISLYSEYLTNNPDYIDKKLINEFKLKYDLDDTYAFYLLITSKLYLDDDEYLKEKYIKESIKLLDINKYMNNEYYKNIIIPNKDIGKWSFKWKYYKSYESFIYNSIELLDDFREIPKLGYFNKPFKYPCVLEDNNEWMLIIPNEIETMKKPLDLVYGNVLVFGLGLGYFPYMASIKNNVNKITIVEKDESIIKLFKDVILPQFNYSYKIEIVKCDVFDYLNNNIKGSNYDFIFADIWHDISDGFMLYLKIKSYENIYKNIKFKYWIEDDLLSVLRRYVIIVLSSNINKNIDNETINKLIDNIYSYCQYESNIYNIINRINELLDNVEISEYEDIIKYIKNDYLKLLSVKFIKSK